MKFSIPHFSPIMFLKLAMLLLAVMGSIVIVMPIIQNTPVKVSVSPIQANPLIDSALVIADGNKLFLRGVFEISNPTLFERIVIIEDEGGSFLQVVCIVSCAIVGLRALVKLKNGGLLNADISKQIFFIGLIILLFYFLERYQINMTNKIVTVRTKNQFALLKQGSGFLPSSVISAIVMGLGIILRKAYTLKQEQDLTI